MTDLKNPWDGFKTSAIPLTAQPLLFAKLAAEQGAELFEALINPDEWEPSDVVQHVEMRRAIESGDQAEIWERAIDGFYDPENAAEESGRRRVLLDGGALCRECSLSFNAWWWAG